MSTTLEIKELDIDIIPPITSRMNDPEYGGSKIVIVGKPGTGKCLAEGTLVMMYDGTLKKVENIRAGELLMGDDSTPRTVLSTCSGIDNMYKVIQSNGNSYTVNEPHILSLKNKENKTIDISVNNLLSISKNIKYKGYKTALNFNTQYINFDPYIYGLNITHTNDTDFNKVKINSLEIRQQFLSGVIDNLAFYEPTYNHYHISHNNKKLFYDIVFIARSIGLVVDTIFDKNTRLYNCYIYGDIKNIPSKKYTPKHNTNPDYTNLTYKIKIQYVGKGQYYGFQLDGNHRFLLADFTVTHNTTLIKSILYSKKHIFPVAMVMNGSEDSNFAYAGQNNDGFIPSTFVYNEYNEEKLKDFIKRQKIAKKHLENPWAVLLIDDCTDDTKVLHKPLQQALFKRGRHFKMLYLLSLQYAMDVKPVIRCNVDGIFILREPILKNRKSLWENYASIVPDFSIFCQLMDKLTDDYCCLYIQNVAGTNNFLDCIYWYKAKPLPENWQFGSDVYIDHHNQRYNTDYVDPIIA
jgi:hypothetical protein